MIRLMRYLAPLFFMVCAGLRCFLETSMFGRTDSFSYYTLTHHTLWYLSAMLGTMLTLHLMLKIELKQLNWLFYGAVVFFIPIGYTLVTGEKLDLKYLDPTPLTIFKSSLSACFLNISNRPQFFEIVIIDTGILILGWLKSKSFKKAFVTMVTVHAVMTLFGIKWFYSKTGSPGLIRITTHLSNHIWLSLIWLFASTFLIQVILLKTSWGKTKKNFIKAICSGLLLWAGAVLALKLFQKDMVLFDAWATTMPVYTAGVIAIVCLLSRGEKYPGHTRALLTSTLGIQLAVILPIILNIWQNLINGPLVVPF